MSGEQPTNPYNLESVPSFLVEIPDRFLGNLLTLMVKAGNFAISERKQADLDVQTKGVEDFVTKVDISNQNFLVKELLKTDWQETLNLESPVTIGFVLEEDTELTKS